MISALFVFALSVQLPVQVPPVHSAAHPGADSLAWGDYDGDGLPDALAVRPGVALRLLRNAGGGALVDVTGTVGLAGCEAPLAGLWQDADGDGDLDLLVVGERGLALFANGAGAFLDGTARAGLDRLAGVRGARWLDFDLDGRPDLELAALGGAVLLHNAGDGRFERVELGLPGPEVLALPDFGGGEAAAEDELGRAGGGEPAASGGAAQPAAVGPGISAERAPLRPAAQAAGICAATLLDAALGGCLEASSVPQLGALMPLSLDFNLDPAGNVGLGTTTPAARLDVVGDVRASGKLVSTTTGGAPLAVASSTKVAGLNADLLDGLDSAAFSQLGSSIDGSEVVDGSLTAADLAPDSVGTSELASKSVTAAELAIGAVGSSAVADGSLVDADVSAAAAIAGVKIVPDFGFQDVTTAGRLAVGAGLPQAKAHVAESSLGLTAGALFSEDLVVESSEAGLGLFSDGGGQFGSALSLKEIAGGALADSWSLVRETSGSGADLRFTYGSDPVPYLNSARLSLQSDGDVGIGTTLPGARLHVLGGSDVTPAGGGELQLGSSSGANLGLDGNEIMARQNGAAADLALNAEGGDVTIAASAATGGLGIGTGSPLGRLHVVDASGGDGSVRLPTSSISSVELLNEAGLAFDRNSASSILVSAVSPAADVLASATITCPSGGYVLAIARARQFGGSNAAVELSVALDGVSHDPNNLVAYDLVETTTSHQLEVIGALAVTSGSHQLNFLASNQAGFSGNKVFFDANLALIFLPTAYGTVDP